MEGIAGSDPWLNAGPGVGSSGRRQRLQARAMSSVIALGCFGAVGVSIQPPAEAASASRFVCGSDGGVPTTEAITLDGRNVSVIRWTSRVFAGSGWSAQRRCQEVSSRFEQFRQQGRLRFITTGRMRGQSVLCTALSSGGACDGLLYTLKPGQDPSATLARLLELRVKARGPLNETGPRLYVSIDTLLQQPDDRVAETAGSTVSSLDPASRELRQAPSSSPLW